MKIVCDDEFSSIIDAIFDKTQIRYSGQGLDNVSPESEHNRLQSIVGEISRSLRF
jgi:hypothetical protein